jgi:hypothetical protein
MTITANVVADSISPAGIQITTFELEFPRFILPEFNTHRAFSRNAQSSRAVPVKVALDLVLRNTAQPIHWGKNQPGMSAAEECNEPIRLDQWSPELSREDAWTVARNQAIDIAEAFSEAGYHKQIVNRLTEPFTHIKVVCTATEYDNFFWLRRHPDAQPEIRELANAMWDARLASIPMKLAHGDWHVPYWKDGHETSGDGTEIKKALMVSASCAAQVSYRKLDDSEEKAERIFRQLIESKPCHASPTEHQATPMPEISKFSSAHPSGTTHFSYDKGVLVPWSGNFRGWIQHRQLIPDNACWDYQGDQSE